LYIINNGNIADKLENQMFAILKGNPYGELIWAATLDTQEEAIERCNEEMLEMEETIFAVQVFGFRQQLD